MDWMSGFIQNMLMKFIHEKKELWEDFLDTSVYAYNTSVHESSKYSPYELMFGRKAILPIDLEMSDKGASELLTEYMDHQEGN